MLYSLAQFPELFMDPFFQLLTSTLVTFVKGANLPLSRGSVNWKELSAVVLQAELCVKPFQCGALFSLL